MNTAAFRRIVRRHYREQKRDLPWRETRNPYCIFVSEVMLQQTQVPRVVKMYPLFIKRFPSFRSLAKAALSDVLRAWQGMGYNRRALNMKRAAELIIAEHGGRLPRDPELLVKLPGIGKATAASICAFAFNKPTVFIETNIRRVFIHHFFEGRRDVPDSEILPLVKKTLDRKDPHTWYSALMDYSTWLAATVENPNRHSKHYTKQPRFEGSDRQIRGRILEALIAGGKRETTIRKLIPDERVLRILARLVHERMIRKERGIYRV